MFLNFDRIKNFSSVESFIRLIGEEFSKILLASFLEKYDRVLHDKREELDKNIIYHPKKKIKSCVKTSFGDVTYFRWYYISENKLTGEKEYVFLLDKKLDILFAGKFSLNAVLKLAELITEDSYRDTAAKGFALAGMDLSHTTVHSLIRRLGDKIKDIKLATEMREGEEEQKKDIEILFEERDGVHINMQGKDREESLKGRKREMKLACFYEGFEIESENKRTGEVRYSCKNKRAICGFEKGAEFLERKESYVEKIYNTKKLFPRVVNTDGAYWCKQDVHYNAYYQLDRFHAMQAITRGGLTKKQQKEIAVFILECKPKRAIKKIAEIYKENSDLKKIKRANANLSLLTYFKQNEKALIPYTENKKFMRLLSKLPKNTILNNLGTMESTVQSLVALRMKKRKCSFTKEGALALCNIIILKRERKITDEFLSLASEEKIADKLFPLELESENILKEQAIPVLKKGLEIISNLKNTLTK